MPLTDPGLPTAESPRIKWGKLYGAATALVLAEAAPLAPGPLIVVTRNSRDAEQLSEEIAFFAGLGLPVRVFPDLETLPYDGFSAQPGGGDVRVGGKALEGQRLEIGKRPRGQAQTGEKCDHFPQLLGVRRIQGDH